MCNNVTELGQYRYEVVGDWIKLRDGKNHNWHFSSNIVKMKELRRMRWVGHVTHMKKMTNTYTVLVGKREEEKPLERPTS
jgi:hypothetical protein